MDSPTSSVPVSAILRAPLTARTWRELLYLLAGAVVAAIGLALTVVLLATSAFLAVSLVGLPLLALTILGARHYAELHRLLARNLLGEDIETPVARRMRPGLLGWLRSRLLDVDGWRAIAYTVLAFPLRLAGLYASVVGWGIAVTWITYPVWWQVGDPVNTDADGVVHHSGMQLGDFYFETWPAAFALMLAGLVLALAVPWVTRGFVQLDRLLMRALLGPTPESTRVRDLEDTRAQAVDDSAATLRRIERDLHDGTQARLVAMAMQLDLAKETLIDDPDREVDVERARQLVETAHHNATEAMTELRGITRSIHPPVLDRGLDHALATLAARSGVPVALHTDLPDRPSPAIETIAYFCAAELLTNVAKHSGGARASIDVSQDVDVLRLQVTDTGPGGAHLRDGRGLAGLADRIRPVDGRLSIASPAGGPTVVTVELPYR